MRIKKIIVSRPESHRSSQRPAIDRNEGGGLFSQKNGVCTHCHDLDLDGLFAQRQLTDLGMGMPLVNLEQFTSHHRSSPCEICSFLAQSTPLLTSEIPRTWHVRAFDYDRLRARLEFDDEISIVDYSCILSRSTTANDLIRAPNLVLALTPDSVHDHCSQDPEQDPSYCILPLKRLSTTTSSLGYEGRLVEETLNYSFVRESLHHCLERHDQHCQPQYGPLRVRPFPDLQVIDCQSETIVDFPGGSYAALSYCIGPRQHGEQRPPDLKYSAGWPRVVIDAVECCRNLEIRYLWVDQLCIDQSDAARLAEAMSHMDLIYSSATLTIVSLAAQQSDGLPGVGGTFRAPCPRLVTGQNTYVSIPAHLVHALKTSKWMTRGWCYQEAALSKRLLIFGPDQAYFVCNTSMVFESITRELSHTSSLEGKRPGSRTSPHMLALSKGPHQHGPWIFGQWIAAYTARDLSYQSDVLDAFRGILNTSPHRTYWGIPFVQQSGRRLYSHAEAFAIGLSWETTYNVNCFDPSWEGLITPLGAGSYRRPEFPSWSWAGCKVFKTPIAYHGSDWRPFEAERDLDIIVNYGDIQIAFEDESGTAVPAADFIRQQNGSGQVLRERSRFIHVETATVQLRMHQLENDMVSDIYEMDEAAARGDIYGVDHSLGPYHGNDHIDWSNIARFCVNVDQHPNFAPRLSYYTLDPDNDEYMVDLDWPPTTQDGRNKEIHGREYLGLILFFCPWKRSAEETTPMSTALVDRGAYCVLMCERHESGAYYTRVGRAWIPDGHLPYFTIHRQTIRLG